VRVGRSTLDGSRTVSRRRAARFSFVIAVVVVDNEDCAVSDLRTDRQDDPVKLYLAEIGRYPLLTKADEVRLAHDIEVGKRARHELLSEERLTRARKKELEGLVRDGERAWSSFVQSNLRLVVSVAKKYAGSSVPLLDLIQEGNLGLMHAVGKFDARRGFKFSTYAVWWIRQAITRGIPENQRAIRLPTHAHEALLQLRSARTRLYAAYCHPPTVDELSAEVGRTASSVVTILQYESDPISLHETLGPDGDALLADIIADPFEESPDDAAMNTQLSREVDTLLHRLTERERTILRMRFGLDGTDTSTLQQIADRLGVTRERIRQIEVAALRKLREEFGDTARELLAS
jgi:RNA polymerase sigma factor (sigma-70 family)